LLQNSPKATTTSRSLSRNQKSKAPSEKSHQMQERDKIAHPEAEVS